MMDAKEALAVFDGMKENLRNLVVTRPKEANGLDFSFVTPTLLGICIKQMLISSSKIIFTLSQ